ncbi:MAG TPA: DUF1206 domain-containing protein, partial [Pseudonocardia sp.]|nr:DUF1206 domain-containing protein [Pseudonocardia sp.]
MTSAAGSASHQASHKAHEATDNRWVRTGVRVGLASYGVTHLLIAWIALQVAFGGGGQQANQKGAFQELADNTFGQVLLWVIVLGFVAIALWRLGQAIWGYRYVSDDKKRLRKRAASAFKVVVFATLAVWAATTAAGSGSGGGGGQKATAGVLGQPGGPFLVGLAGVLVVVVGLVVAWYGLTKQFERNLRVGQMRARTRQVAVGTGRIGYAAKGAAYAIVGVLLVVAATTYSSHKSTGL